MRPPKELKLSIQQVQELLSALKQHGGKAMVHGLRGKTSNHKIEERIEQQAVKILKLLYTKVLGPRWLPNT
jgi:hypothetical protein